jgi:hypothetical protein
MMDNLGRLKLSDCIVRLVVFTCFVRWLTWTALRMSETTVFEKKVWTENHYPKVAFSKTLRDTCEEALRIHKMNGCVRLVLRFIFCHYWQRSSIRGFVVMRYSEWDIVRLRRQGVSGAVAQIRVHCLIPIAMQIRSVSMPSMRHHLFHPQDVFLG